MWRHLKTRSQTGASTAGPHGRRLGFEGLEPRLVLSITVDTDLDVVDEFDGKTSLREAVAAAVDGETISIEVASPVLFLDHPDGEISINRSLSIIGPGAEALSIVPVGDDRRAFRIDDGSLSQLAQVTIQGLTLAGGNVAADGGSIWSSERLALVSVVVTGGTAGGRGGGVYSEGPLTLTDARITLNHADIDGGGVWCRGGFESTRSEIQLNSAREDGGGAHLSAGSVFIDSSVSSNQATDDGGGVWSSGDLEILRSTISGNTGSDSGGGIYAENGLDLTNSTVSGNWVTDEFGLGLGAGVFARGDLNFRSSTVVFNHAAGVNAFGGGVWNDDDDITITSTIIAQNTAAGGNPDLRLGSGSLTLSHSLIGDLSGTQLVEAQTPDASGNLIGDSQGVSLIDPRLDPLQNNGGPTLTHAPRENSPALDLGGDSAESSDQRGLPFARVFDGDSDGVSLLDAGSVERQRELILVDLVTDESDDDHAPGDLSLREAIELGNDSLGDFPPLIAFHPSLSGQTILLDDALGQLEVTADLLISGIELDEPLTIDARHGSDRIPGTGDGFRVLYSTADSIILEGLVLRGGDQGGDNEPGGGIYSTGGVVLRDSQVLDNSTHGARSRGGGVAAEDVQLIRSSVSGNSTNGVASHGGGVYGNVTSEDAHVEQNATHGSDSHGGGVYLPWEIGIDDRVLSGIVVTGNETTGSGSDGGGVYAQRAYVEGSQRIRVEDAVIVGNAASGSGGGVATREASLIVERSLVTGNSSLADGGGLFAEYSSASGSGTLRLYDSVVEGNSADGKGGGVFAGWATIRRSSLSGNSGDGHGAAIYANYGFLTLEDVTVTGNSSGVLTSSHGRGFNSSFVRTTISDNQGVGIAVRSGSSVLGTTLPLIQSTVSGNSGGAILVLENVYLNRIDASNATIVGDITVEFGGLDFDLDHSIYAGRISLGDVFFFDVDATNSLISDNTNTDLVEAPLGSPDAEGNLIGGPVFGMIDPQLGLLADNGGLTPTHAPLVGSPVVDAGLTTGDGFDQRGVPFGRLQDGDYDGVARRDIGAYEVQRPTYPALFGDYNEDGVVDAADYTVWRDAEGEGVLGLYAGPDGDGNGRIDAADRQVWANNYGLAATIPQIGFTPTIDGTVDAGWLSVAARELPYNVYRSTPSDSDASAEWRAVWDETRLSFLVEVVDDQLFANDATLYADDAVEIHIDPDFSRGDAYDGVNDTKYLLQWGDTQVYLSDSSPAGMLNGVEFAQTTTPTGYLVEFSVPWSTLGILPSDGDKIGIEVSVLDDDGGSPVDHKLQWHSSVNRAFLEPSRFGPTRLVDLAGEESSLSLSGDPSGGTLQPSASTQFGFFAADVSASDSVDAPSTLTRAVDYRDADEALLLLASGHQSQLRADTRAVSEELASAEERDVSQQSLEDAWAEVDWSEFD